MERVDRLILKAQRKAGLKLSSYELAMKENPYIGCDKESLIDLLSDPREDWRQITQALVWR